MYKRQDEPKGLDGESSYRSYDNIRTYVTSKVPGYKFLTDQDVTVRREPGASNAQNPFYVGSASVLTPFHNATLQYYNNGTGSIYYRQAFKGYLNRKLSAATEFSTNPNAAKNGDRRLDATTGTFTSYYTGSYASCLLYTSPHRCLPQQPLVSQRLRLAWSSLPLLQLRRGQDAPPAHLGYLQRL